MRSRRNWVLAILFIAFGACASPANAGGIYMAKSESGAQLFQLVASPGGDLSGSATFVEVSDAGKLTTTQFALSGAKEGKAIQLVVKRGILGDVHLVAEEIAVGLRVSAPAKNGGMTAGVLKKTTISEFEAATSQLRKIAAQRTTAQARTEAVRVATRQLERKTSALAEIDEDVRSFLKARKDAGGYAERVSVAYASLESQIDRLVSNQPKNADPIGQNNALIDLRNALLDIEYRARDIDSEVLMTTADHVSDAARLRQVLAHFDRRCDIGDEDVGNDVANSVKDRWRATCGRLAAALPDASVAFDDTSAVADRFKELVSLSQQRRVALSQRS